MRAVLTDADAACMEAFSFQYRRNTLYRRYCDLMNVDIASVRSPLDIPFLPVGFFKTQTLLASDRPASLIFESSGTTGEARSRHHVARPDWYLESLTNGFIRSYGTMENYCFLCLLPDYRERPGSSLAYMCRAFIERSRHPISGFYLNDFKGLHRAMQELEARNQPTILLGVTYSLLDFADQFPMPLKHIRVMETGGMKGRRKELTRKEVHETLCNRFQCAHIHSEYGMTELLSQAYSFSGGLFHCPPWMRILIRDETDPRNIQGTSAAPVRGAVNVIDLANRFSCPFIATDDAGILHPDGQFEILGRIDFSDIRGCSLLSI